MRICLPHTVAEMTVEQTKQGKLLDAQLSEQQTSPSEMQSSAYHLFSFSSPAILML